MRRLGAFVGALVVLAVITAGTAGATDTFSISGEIDGLYPGWHGVLEAHVTNTLDVPIRVEQVSGVVDGGSSGCTSSTITIIPTKTSLELAPGESGTVALDTAMRSDAGDECQGVSFPVRFTGTSLAQDRPPPSLAFTGGNIATLLGLALVALGAGFALEIHRRKGWGS